MKLIVGLGNPGRRYSRHRHNIGFHVIDYLAGQWNIDVCNKQFKSLIGKGLIENRPAILIKPETFMNLSGEAVASIAGYYKIECHDIIVIHDDLDISFGKIKIDTNRGHGGHNGIRSIYQMLSSKDIYRIRFGIGRPPNYMNPADYVLQAFDSNDDIQLKELINTASRAIKCLVSDMTLADVQQRFHTN